MLRRLIKLLLRAATSAVSFIDEYPNFRAAVIRLMRFVRLYNIARRIYARLRSTRWRRGAPLHSMDLKDLTPRARVLYDQLEILLKSEGDR